MPRRESVEFTWDDFYAVWFALLLYYLAAVAVIELRRAVG